MPMVKHGDSLTCVYLNGQFVAAEQATVSAFDRGFIFADGVYEIIPAYGGRPFRLERHLDRFERSLQAIGLSNPMDRGAWTRLAERLAASGDGADLSLYLQVTRGPAPRDHGFPERVTPTVFAYAQRLEPAPPRVLSEGVAAVTLEDIRWRRCDIKATALLANVILRQQAAVQGAQEAILVRDGQVTEGAASNIFVVRDGVVKTPPTGPDILAGVTRDLVLELARQSSVACSEAPVGVDELFEAEEVWMSSSTREILPITRIDGRTIGSGRPGPTFARLYGRYQEYKARFRAGEVR